MTQTELANQSGQLKGTISAIECGASQNPQLKTVKPIADVLGIPWSEVIAAKAGDAASSAAAYSAIPAEPSREALTT